MEHFVPPTIMTQVSDKEQTTNWENVVISLQATIWYSSCKVNARCVVAQCDAKLQMCAICRNWVNLQMSLHTFAPIC